MRDSQRYRDVGSSDVSLKALAKIGQAFRIVSVKMAHRTSEGNHPRRVREKS